MVSSNKELHTAGGEREAGSAVSRRWGTRGIFSGFQNQEEHFRACGTREIVLDEEEDIEMSVLYKGTDEIRFNITALGAMYLPGSGGPCWALRCHRLLPWPAQGSLLGTVSDHPAVTAAGTRVNPPSSSYPEPAHSRRDFKLLPLRGES